MGKEMEVIRKTVIKTVDANGQNVEIELTEEQVEKLRQELGAKADKEIVYVPYTVPAPPVYVPIPSYPTWPSTAPQITWTVGTTNWGTTHAKFLNGLALNSGESKTFQFCGP